MYSPYVDTCQDLWPMCTHNMWILVRIYDIYVLTTPYVDTCQDLWQPCIHHMWILVRISDTFVLTIFGYIWDTFVLTICGYLSESMTLMNSPYTCQDLWQTCTHHMWILVRICDTYVLTICGYLSGSVTLMSVILMLRNWSTECSVPQMLNCNKSSFLFSNIPTRHSVGCKDKIQNSLHYR